MISFIVRGQTSPVKLNCDTCVPPLCSECLGGVQGDGPAVPGGGPAARQLALRRPGAVADHRGDRHHHAGSSLGQRSPLPARKYVVHGHRVGLLLTESHMKGDNHLLKLHRPCSRGFLSHSVICSPIHCTVDIRFNL